MTHKCYTRLEGSEEMPTKLWVLLAHLRIYVWTYVRLGLGLALLIGGGTWMDETGVDSKGQAPIFALIAVAIQTLRIIPIPKNDDAMVGLERLLMSAMLVLAALLSAFHWAVSADQGLLFNGTAASLAVLTMLLLFFVTAKRWRWR